MNAALWLILMRGGAFVEEVNLIFGESVEFAAKRQQMTASTRGRQVASNRTRQIDHERLP
jgi:hypothetical protein